MSKGIAKELGQELRSVLSSRSTTWDTVLSASAYAVVQALAGWRWGLAVAAGISLSLIVVRALRRQPWAYALAGLILALLAGLLALLTGRAQALFLPDIISGAVTVLLLLLSLLWRKPLAAWASHLSRGWPLGWYWQERVLPAYAEVTGGWLAYSLIRLVVYLVLWQRGDAAVLGWMRLILGWPTMVVVLVLSYLYGLRRLGQLAGPSVIEYKQGKAAPWDGQQRGF